MFKKIALCFCFISCFSYASEQAATSASAVSIPSAVLPDISPKAFGVTGGKAYIEALHDYAQALLMQHRWFKVAFDAIAIREKMSKMQEESSLNFSNRMAWLGQDREGCFVHDEEPIFFKTLQELKQALESRKDHELLLKTPEGDAIFAATSEGIAFLLKYKSLFFQDITAPKDKTVIDEIFQQTKHQDNFELFLLAQFLKLRREGAQLNVVMKQQQERYGACGKDVLDSQQRLQNADCYTLSDGLRACLDSTSKLVQALNNLGRPIMFVFMPTKEQLLTEYNRTQPQLYAVVRKKLQELTLHMAIKDRRFCAYSNTVKGEHLPEHLEPLDASSNPLERNQAVSGVQQPVQSAVAPLPQAKCKAVKKQKKPAKQHVKKEKQHKASHHVATSQDYSLQAEEQDERPAPATSSAQPIQVAVPVKQKEQSKDNPGTSFCTEQKSEQSAVQAEIPVEAAPAPSTLTACEYKEVKDGVMHAAVVSSAHHEMPFLIDISGYSDGKVISDGEGATIVIDDPCNKMRLNLYPTDGCKRINYQPCYKKNILRWFQSAKEALSEKHVSTVPEQNNALRIHRFSRLVDQFIPTMGVIQTVPSRIIGHDPEREIAIPGNVEFYESATKKRSCLFVYLVDSVSGKCFHRNMQFRDALKVIADFYKKGFFEVERPPLYMQNH